MKYKITLLTLMLFCLGSMAWSQKATLSGKIMSEGAPVPGATVQIVGSTKGAAADDSGNYRITDIDASSVTVKISSIGFEDKTQNLTLKAGDNTLDVSIAELGKFLEEVVVTGLSINTKQKEQGTSRASLSGNAIRSMPAPTIENALSGRMAGVEAYSADGAPGGGYRFRIRGGNSLLGASEPLVIIDGVIMDNSNRNTTSGAAGNTGAASFGMNNGTRGLAAINPADIESLEVLKGAAAASLYGSRASAGVIVVKTKSGGKGKLSVNYGLDLGIATVSRSIQNYKTDWSSADIDQWVTFKNAPLAAAAQITAAEIAQYKKNNLTDWSKRPFQNGLFQRHTLNLQGGDKDFGYYVTLNHQNTDGHIKGTEFKTKGGRISLSSQPIDRLSLRLTGSYNKDFRTILPGGSPGFFIPNRWTVAALQLPFMRQDDQRPAFLAGTFGIKNPTEYARIQKRMDVERRQLSGNINYKILEDLSIDVNAGVDNSFMDGRTIYPFGLVTLFPVGRLDFDTEELIQKTLSVGINHLWKMNDKFYVKSAVGTQYDENSRKYFYKRFQTFDANRGDELDTISYTAGQPGSVLNFNPIVRTFGVYVNETFGIGKKLFVNLGGRFDRSTSYVEQFFFYPRASLSYQLTDNIRLRGAYGTSGIQPPPYQINLTYAFEGAGYNGSAGGYRFSNPGNKDLKPEKQTELEFGIDASLLNKRVNVELSYYNKTFTDMLFNGSVAPDINNGFTRFIRNIAQMYNKGFEFNVSAVLVRAKNLDVSVGFNGATLENKITKLNEPVRPEFGGVENVAQLRPNYSISAFYGGLSTSTAFGDRTYIGPSIPKFEGSFNTTIAYKKFTLIALLGGKGGYYRFNTTDRDLANPVARMHKEYWSLPLDQATAKFNDLTQWVQKADFLKLRQLGISYTFTPTDMSGIIKSFTVGINGSNLHTWSKYKGGYDIEAETSGSGAGNSWVRSIDAWEAGPPRQWTLSFNVGF
jgi:TonB-dependent starch-binding outer membrane protein SusC